MLSQIQQGQFIESAEFSGNLYGTSVKAVQDVTKQGRCCVLDIELQGVRSVRKLGDSLGAPRFVFIAPPEPALDVLRGRLGGRGTETEESLERRLNTAKEALDAAKEPGLYDKVIVNDVLEDAYQEFKAFMLEDLQETQ